MAKPSAAALSLSELIKTTSSELRAARASEPKNAVMKFEECELELAVTLKGEAGGGFKIWLIDASAKVAAESVSRIKLRFSPAAPEGVQFLVKRSGSRLPDKSAI